MPFINLGNKNSQQDVDQQAQSQENTQPNTASSSNNQDVPAAPQPHLDPGAQDNSGSHQAQVSTDPKTGIRQIKGAEVSPTSGGQAQSQQQQQIKPQVQQQQTQPQVNQAVSTDDSNNNSNQEPLVGKQNPVQNTSQNEQTQQSPQPQNPNTTNQQQPQEHGAKGMDNNSETPPTETITSPAGYDSQLHDIQIGKSKQSEGKKQGESSNQNAVGPSNIEPKLSVRKSQHTNNKQDENLQQKVGTKQTAEQTQAQQDDGVELMSGGNQNLPPLQNRDEQQVSNLQKKGNDEQQVEVKTNATSLDQLLKTAIKMKASDLHLTADYRAMVRVDGKLEAIKSQRLTHESIMRMLEPVVAPVDGVDLKEDRDLDLSYDLPEANARFRVNIGYQQSTITATFRLIPAQIMAPDQLGLPVVAEGFTKFSQGLVLVTGPTGSGKSTTLSSLVNLINMREPKHIITIEDPIEYKYPRGKALVDQRAVHVDTKSWHNALRATLRQDPDVVLIGEMRDLETMEAALQVAETGHLVFSTLHTNTAAQTIDRVIDAFPQNKQSQVRTQLGTVLMAVISQRLIPTGGKGRKLACEVMVVNAAIRNAIREEKVFQIDNMIQTGADLGMITMEKSLSSLVKRGFISSDIAKRYANRPEELMSMLN